MGDDKSNTRRADNEEDRQEEYDDDDDEEELLNLEEAELELEEEHTRVLQAQQAREREQQSVKSERSIEIAARRQRLAVRQAELDEAKRLLKQPITSKPAEPKRQLDFATPFSRNHPDMYAAAIGKPARRATMSVFDEDDDNVEAELMIRVPMPANFDGSGLSSSSNEPSESVQVRLAYALDAIVDYIEFMADFKNVRPSARQFVKLACRFLTGAAAGVYKDLQLIAKQEAERRGDDAPVLVLWPDVRRALESRFGKPQPGHQLIRIMMALKQKPGESVECYTVRFNSLHMELTRQSLASRDLTVALYIQGLSSLIKEKVEEVVNSIDYFDREDIGVHEARKAITSLHLIAAARENHLASIARQQSHGATPARSSAPVPSIQSSSNSHHSRGSNGNNNKKNGDNGNRVQVPDLLYSERIAAGLCGKCNSAAHSARDCSSSRNLLPVPRRNGARANKMEVSECVEDGGEPKKL